MSKTKSQPLLVTTAHKGVFFGYGQPTTEPTIVLEQAQMCVYWDTSVKGVLGLALTGPSKSCRIGPPVAKIHLRDITAVVEVTPEAEAKWKQQFWG